MSRTNVLPSLFKRRLSVSTNTPFAFSKAADTILVMNLEIKWTSLRMIVPRPVGLATLTTILPYAEIRVFPAPAMSGSIDANFFFDGFVVHCVVTYVYVGPETNDP